jgi:hypothetical protein
MTTPTVFDTEIRVQKALQEREGGETEVETPLGYIDLLTSSHVVEIKHVIDWKDGLKVLLLAKYFPDRKPRIHLFGSYATATRALVEQALGELGIETSWEQDPS